MSARSISHRTVALGAISTLRAYHGLRWGDAGQLHRQRDFSRAACGMTAEIIYLAERRAAKDGPMTRKEIEDTMADELIRSRDVSKMTTLSVRKIQQMAIAGRIPSAARLGNIWTFDPDAIRAWIVEQREKVTEAARRPPARGFSPPPMHAVWRAPDAAIDEAYERLIRGKRGRGPNRG